MQKFTQFCLIFLLVSIFQWWSPFVGIDAAQSDFKNFNALTIKMVKKMLPNEDWMEGKNIQQNDISHFSAIFPIKNVKLFLKNIYKNILPKFFNKNEETGKYECVKNHIWKWGNPEGNFVKILLENGLINNIIDSTSEKWLIDMELNNNSEENLYQFKLFFSFLTRLSFTIGQTAFDEADFHIDYFVRAFNCIRLFLSYPFDVYLNSSFKLMRNNQILMCFEEEKNFQIKGRKNANFKSIQTLLSMKKLLVSECIEIVEIIAKNQNGWGWKEANPIPLLWDRTEKGKLFRQILNTLTDDPTNAEAIYAIRNFGQNLAVRILNDFKHLEEGKQYLREFNGIELKLKFLIRKIDKMKIFGHIDEELIVKKEIYMHFEDAIQMDFDTNKEYLSIASKMSNTCENLQKLLENCKFQKIDEQIQCELRPSEKNKFKEFKEFIEITEKKFFEKFQINLLKNEIEEKMEKFEEIKNAIENHTNDIRMINIKCAELTIQQMEEWKICDENGNKIELNEKEIEELKKQAEIFGKEWQNLKQEIQEKLKEFLTRIKEIEENLKGKIMENS